MFKENENIRPNATPERVFAVCRLVANGNYTYNELTDLLKLEDKNVLPLNRNGGQDNEALGKSIEAAIELDLIRIENNHYELNIRQDTIKNTDNFRKEIVDRIFSKRNTTFFKITEWFIATSNDLFEVNKYEDLSVKAIRADIANVSENAILGWRFWMRYLGFGYQYKGILIPNMRTRLLDAFEKHKTKSKFDCIEFLQWIKEYIPEASCCSEAGLPLAMSNALRTLHNENLIKLKSEKDAIRIPLYHIDGVQLNDFSEIELLGV